jgi:hypothetical protein
MLGIEPRASHILGKNCNRVASPSPKKATLVCPFKYKNVSQVPVAHTCNPNYLDWEDHGSRPTWTNSLRPHLNQQLAQGHMSVTPRYTVRVGGS